ncbi:MAG: AMIN domain-containing protein, partial [Deltaproteobacteria bacterium]|nr:AMIN domain-containing protein [Deltaproteobacteria bacterium]
MAGCATKGPSEPVVGQAEPEQADRVIQGIAVSEDESAVLVTIESNQPLIYSAIKRVLPPGVVLYFPGTSLLGVEESYSPPSPLIKSISAAQSIEQEGASRIQINLSEDARYNITQDESRITVHLTKPGQEPAAQALDETKEPAAASQPEKTVVAEKEIQPKPTPG